MRDRKVQSPVLSPDLVSCRSHLHPHRRGAVARGFGVSEGLTGKNWGLAEIFC
ncbi:protein of unknown function [Aminobacter niigataensis]|nr:protein of unknown function [Aminobacter niigataensis]